MRPEIFADRVLASLGPVPITRTMLTSSATSLLLIALCGMLARAVVRRPSGRLAAAGRLSFGFLHDLVTEAAGRASPGLEVFAGSLFLFIAAAAVVGQLPAVPAPTANLAATSALAALVFLAVPFAGIRARGLLGYVKHYFRPNPILFPLHLISELEAPKPRSDVLWSRSSPPLAMHKPRRWPRRSGASRANRLPGFWTP